MKRFRHFRAVAGGCATWLVVAWAVPAGAQAPEGWEMEEPAEEDDFEPEDEEPDDFEESSDLVPEPVGDSDWSPVEKEGETYLFVGARYRAIVVPQSFINLFVDGGQGVFVNSGGVEFGIRRNNFEILPAIWFARYALQDAPFKAKSDGPDAWELINANLNVIYFTTDFLFSTPITDEFAVNYGAGVGLGVVTGNINRNEAYFPPPGLPGNPDGSGLERCAGPGNPSSAGIQCPDIGGNYNYTQSPWPVFPWLAVQTGLRYKPHKSFVARLDLGLSTSGLFFGLGLDYGL